MTTKTDWRVLIVPTHPGVQYHFCRVGFPTFFLGNWDQFQYWRPRPENVHNLLPAFEDSQLDLQPDDYARLLDDPTHFRFPGDFDLAWLMFNWQYKLFRERRSIRKLFRVAKVQELDREEWSELLERDDFTVVSFYPNTVDWLKNTFDVTVPYVPLGLDSTTYQGYTGEERTILSVIHSWSDRGWHYPAYLEATRDLPTNHIDHLDSNKVVQSYADIQRAYQRSRLYLHDGEQEYTITLLEAMMTGMPLVSFKIPGIERYVVHGVNGFVGRTASEIREYCRMLLDDPALASAMGKKSREQALLHYAEPRWRADWIEIIDEFLKRPGGP